MCLFVCTALLFGEFCAANGLFHLVCIHPLWMSFNYVQGIFFSDCAKGDASPILLTVQGGLDILLIVSGVS